MTDKTKEALARSALKLALEAQVAKIMEQAQVFASAWSLVGGRFDGGTAMDDAEVAKNELRQMVVEALALVNKVDQEESSGTEQPDMNLKCKSVQARLATSWGYVKAEQPAQSQIPKSITCPFCESEHVPGWLHDYNMDRDAHGEQPAQPKQKPVAWIHICRKRPELRVLSFEEENPALKAKGYKAYPLTSPLTLSLAQRQARSADAWVGLTQQDIDIAFDDTREGGGFDDFARAIEAKLKAKNSP
jgi:hypothetical protein